MASEYRLTPEADADILLNLPPAGKYWTFLSSARGDYLYKVDSAGNITAVTYTIANTMTTLGDIIYGAALGSATRLGIGTAGQVLTVVGGLPSWAAPAAGGTVTTVSVVTANGFAGTVATDTTTPAITITTSISGLLKGNGTAISAATASDVTGQLLTGYVSGAGVLAATDTILQAFNKLNGNIGALVTGVSSVTGSGNIASSGGATPNITFTGVLPTANGGTGVNIATTALTLGTASSAAGSIVFQNATNANTVTIQSGVTSASYSLTLPIAQGGASTFLQNNGSGVLSWAAAGGGITIGTTAISGSSTGLVLYTKSDGTVQASGLKYTAAGATYDPAIISIGGGINNVIKFINDGGRVLMNLDEGVALGIGANVYNSFSTEKVAVGQFSTATGGNATAIGGVANANAAFSLALGSYANTSAGANSIAIGYLATTTATHQGVLGSKDANGYVDNWYFNGVTHTAPYSVTLNASGGSGSNIAGANLTLASGKATGNAAAGYIAFQTSTVGSSGSTLQTNAERFRISTARVAASVPIGFKAYTVATLPAGTVGDTAYVTDATAPTYLGALVGGGAVACLVFYNGAAWVSC